MKTASKTIYGRPEVLSQKMGMVIPNVWSLVEDVRSDRDNIGGWPAFCFLPSWITSQLLDRYGITDARTIILLSTFAAWRMTKGFYEFDETMLEELWGGSSVDRDVPADVLLQLPEWCPYIATPGREWDGDPIHGFFAHLDCNDDDTDRVLHFVVDGAEGVTCCSLPLGHGSIHDALVYACEVNELEFTEDEFKSNESLVVSLVSMVLFLCMQAGEMTDEAGRPGSPSLPRTRKSKGRLVEVPSSEPARWNVGWRMGAELRNAQIRDAYEDDGYGVGGRKRPHVRRGHFAYRWQGPFGSPERHKKLRWLHPMLVNARSSDDLVTTVRPVS